MRRYNAAKAATSCIDSVRWTTAPPLAVRRIVPTMERRDRT